MTSVLELTREAFRCADAHDVDGFLEFQAADCEWRTPQGPLHGHDEVRAYVGGFQTAFSEGPHEIDRAYPIGDTAVVVEGHWTGKHTGTLTTPDGDVPATGRDVDLPFVLIVERKGSSDQAGRLALYYDQLAFMGQLGLMPEPAAA